MKPSLGDQDFISIFREVGPYELSRRIGTSVNAVYQRRRKLEAKYKIAINGPAHPANSIRPAEYPHRICLDINNGIVLVGSDAHYWPGDPSTSHRAFVKFCKEYEPAAVIMNGDVIDAATISRHPPIGWEKRPTVQQEIECAQERLHEIELAVKRKTPLVWTLGNHDQRFETRLATVAPEFARVNGVHLRDHFPAWKPAWSVWINDDVVVKHRWKSGINAQRSNTLNAGKTMITGHLHRLNVTGLTDYRGTRYGVDTGTLSDPSHAAFVDYTEDAPLDWASGFVVLTFVDGKLLQPELARVFDKNHVEFRGEVIKV